MAPQPNDGSQEAARSRNDTIVMAGHAFEVLLPLAFKKFESDLASGDDARELRAAKILLGLMITWQTDLAHAEAQVNQTRAQLLRARAIYKRGAKVTAARAAGEGEEMPDFVFGGDGGEDQG